MTQTIRERIRALAKAVKEPLPELVQMCLDTPAADLDGSILAEELGAVEAYTTVILVSLHRLLDLVEPKVRNE